MRDPHVAHQFDWKSKAESGAHNPERQRRGQRTVSSCRKGGVALR